MGWITADYRSSIVALHSIQFHPFQSKRVVVVMRNKLELGTNGLIKAHLWP